MALAIKCRCGRILQLQEEIHGPRDVCCPNCQRVLTVPANEAAVTASKPAKNLPVDQPSCSLPSHASSTSHDFSIPEPHDKDLWPVATTGWLVVTIIAAAIFAVVLLGSVARSLFFGNLVLQLRLLGL
jgi:hypothetical protein